MKRLILLGLTIAAVSSCSKNHAPAGELLNTQASTPAGAEANPIDGIVITSFIDTKAGTTATLFGNDIAAKSARSGQTAYPAGSVLKLVTWRQQPDPTWNGARIPAKMESVEIVTFSEETAPVYEHCSGEALKIDASVIGGGSAAQRAEFIAELKAAVMP